MAQPWPTFIPCASLFLICRLQQLQGGWMLTGLASQRFLFFGEHLPSSCLTVTKLPYQFRMRHKVETNIEEGYQSGAHRRQSQVRQSPYRHAISVSSRRIREASEIVASGSRYLVSFGTRQRSHNLQPFFSRVRSSVGSFLLNPFRGTLNPNMESSTAT